MSLPKHPKMRSSWLTPVACFFLISEVFAQSYPYYLTTIKTCTNWYDNSGEYSCEFIRDLMSIPPANFTRWNPSVTLDCGNWEPYISYCTWVDAENPPVSSSTTQSSTVVPVATAKPSPSYWKPVGCWPIGPADFPSLDKNIGIISSITPAKCQDQCLKVPNTDYRFAGLAAGSQCLCGEFVRNELSEKAAVDCGTPCTGDAKQTCGGTNFINIFEADFSGDAPPSTSTAISSSSTSSIPISSTSKTPTSSTSKSTSSPTSTALPVSPDGKCGAASSVRATCKGSTFGSCCSIRGNCGSTIDYCGVPNGCQAGFGACTPVSTNGKCGAASSVGATCIGSTFGSCCSIRGNCGTTLDYCGTPNGCQPAFGKCAPVSTDGKCGSASSTGASCAGSTFGNCCSVKGNCGSSAAFCATKNLCQPLFGQCHPTSLDGKCGSASSTGASCIGSTFGQCCSVKGNCGDTDAFCKTANLCQPVFGTCT